MGDLSKGLLLATDKSVSLVLLCISSPTKSMLQNVHVQVRSRIKEVDSDYDTLLLEKEAAFAVSKSQKDAEAGLFCYVTFTSTALRKSPEEVPKE